MSNHDGRHGGSVQMDRRERLIDFTKSRRKRKRINQLEIERVCLFLHRVEALYYTSDSLASAMEMINLVFWKQKLLGGEKHL